LFGKACNEATPWDRGRLIPTRGEVRMSLTREIKMTRKKIAAPKANGKLSHSPATPEGRARIRTVRDEPSVETMPGTHDVYEKRAT